MLKRGNAACQLAVARLLRQVQSTVLLVVAGAFFVGIVAAQETDSPRVVVVKMIDKSTAQWRFDPAEVSVQRGDTIRFVMDDIVPHNVEFKKVPKATRLGDSTLGPFLFAKGDVYDVVIDDRFGEGVHEYVCTPHEPMGMKGTIVVLASETPMSSQ